MSNKFILSDELACQLQDAFDRCGWTAEEVKGLCEGYVLDNIRKRLFLSSVIDLSIYEFFTDEEYSKAGIGPHRRHVIPSILTSYGKISTIRELVQWSEQDFLNTPYLGPKYLDICKKMLMVHGLHFGMKFD